VTVLHVPARETEGRLPPTIQPQPSAPQPSFDSVTISCTRVAVLPDRAPLPLFEPRGGSSQTCICGKKERATVR